MATYFVAGDQLLVHLSSSRFILGASWLVAPLGTTASTWTLLPSQWSTWQCHLEYIYTHTPKSLQCLRLTAIPNQNARHDPCPGTDLAKPLSPLETLALTSLDQTITVLLFVFDRIPSERRFPTGLFSWVLLTPANKNAKQALFLVCILQDDKGKKRGPKRGQNEVRKKPRIYTHGLWPASRKPALP